MNIIPYFYQVLLTKCFEKRYRNELTFMNRTLQSKLRVGSIFVHENVCSFVATGYKTRPTGTRLIGMLKSARIRLERV